MRDRRFGRVADMVIAVQKRPVEIQGEQPRNGNKRRGRVRIQFSMPIGLVVCHGLSIPLFQKR